MYLNGAVVTTGIEDANVLREEAKGVVRAVRKAVRRSYSRAYLRSLIFIDWGTFKAFFGGVWGVPFLFLILIGSVNTVLEIVVYFMSAKPKWWPWYSAHATFVNCITVAGCLGALVIALGLAVYIKGPSLLLLRRRLLSRLTFAVRLKSGEFLTWSGAQGAPCEVKRLTTKRAYITGTHLLYVLFLDRAGKTVLDVCTWDGSAVWVYLDSSLGTAGRHTTSIMNSLVASFVRIQNKLELARKFLGCEARKLEEEGIAAYVEGDPVRQEICERIRDFLYDDTRQARGLILHGPPGTGKTHLVERLRDLLQVHVEFVTPADLKGSHIGESEARVRSLWEKLRENQPCILFIDECEGVFARRGSERSDTFSDAIVSNFLSEWDGKNRNQRVYVIGSTNVNEALDSAIVSRCDAVLELPLPGVELRHRFVSQEIRESIGQAACERVAHGTAGYSFRDLKKLCEDVARWIKSGTSEQQAISLAMDGRGRGANTHVNPEVTLDSLALSEETEKEVRNLCGMMKHVEAFQEKGVTVPQAILLYGPPGTGKTTLVKAIANATKLAFVAPTTTALKGRFLGHAAGGVGSIFKEARGRAPAIVCIDELDIVAPARTSASGDVLTGEVVGQLLQEMEGVAARTGQLFVIGITNHIDRIDPAVLSRFRKRVYIGYPEAGTLHRVVKKFFESRPCGFDREAIAKAIAERSEGHSMREVQAVLEQAEASAVSRAIEAGDIDQFQIEVEDIPSLDSRPGSAGAVVH